MVGDITVADIKNLLNHWINKGYTYTTVKKNYGVLNEYFQYLHREELIPESDGKCGDDEEKQLFVCAG